MPPKLVYYYYSLMLFYLVTVYKINIGKQYQLVVKIIGSVIFFVHYFQSRIRIRIEFHRRFLFSTMLLATNVFS